MQEATQRHAPRGNVGGEARALVRLGLPLAGSHVLQMAIVVTDTVMMGWYDIPSLAALSLSGPIWYIAFVLGSGFALAVMPLVATASARNDDRQIRRVTRMALWLSAICGLAATPLFFSFHAIFLAAGQDPEVARLGGVYMKFLGASLAPALIVMVMKSYLSALELTRAIFVLMLIGAALNAALDYVLIFGRFGVPEFGIAGAGLAALIGNLAAAAMLVAYAVARRPDHDLFRNIHKPDWEVFATVFRLGWPIGMTSFAEVGLFAAASVMMGWLGTIPLAAHGIALQITALTFMVHMGLSQAATVRIGQTHGESGRGGLHATGFAAMALSLSLAVATIILFLAVPEALVGPYVDPADPERPAILVAGAALLAVAALFQLADSAQVMALGLLRGVQDTRVPMIIASISYWLIGLPAAYVLGFAAGLGAVGIWLGLTCGLASAGVLMQVRFWTRYASIESA